MAWVKNQKSSVNYKNPNNSNFLNFEKDFKNNYMRSFKKEDKLVAERNFNYNYDQKRFSTALKINTLIKYPNIIIDQKILKKF